MRPGAGSTLEKQTAVAWFAGGGPSERVGEAMPADYIGIGDDLSPDHILKLMDAYEKTLDRLGYSPIPYPDTSERCGGNIRTGVKFDCLNHAYWMCDRIRRFVSARRLAKTGRWLGTVQGMLIMGGVFSIDEIMAHDRKPPDPRAIAERGRAGG